MPLTITLDTEALAHLDQLVGHTATLMALRLDAVGDLAFEAAAISYLLAAQYPCATPVQPLDGLADLDLASTVDAALRKVQEFSLEVITAIPDLGQLNVLIVELRYALRHAAAVGEP